VAVRTLYISMWNNGCGSCGGLVYATWTSRGMDGAGFRTDGTADPLWQFTRHGLEMCAAMCIGGTILNLVVFVLGPAVFGYPDLTRNYPGRRGGPTLEMSGISVGLAVVLAALYGVGVIVLPVLLTPWALVDRCGGQSGRPASWARSAS
jgi:hypothetical protein